MQDPQPEFQPAIGVAETLSPGLRRIVAPNPSPMTFRGTNTYLLGQSDIAVIDPGPDSDSHLSALLGALGEGQKITHIFVTHAHLDHSPLARRLSKATGAPVFGFGPATAGRRQIMQDLAASGCVGGGEGVDDDFLPDIIMKDQQEVTGPDWTLQALHTPGHMSNHLCFAWGDILFSGDLVMGWASSLVSPPDGDLNAFMRALDRLSQTKWSILHPGHGAPVRDPQNRIDFLLTHRKSRESAILESLGSGPATASALATQIYTDTPKALLGAATRNVLAHLLDLMERARVEPVDELSETSVFRRLPAK